MKKAILVGIDSKTDSYDITYSLDELEKLAKECEICVIDRLIQKGTPDNVSYIGKGKLEELLVDVKLQEPDIVIFNDELSPLQLRTVSDTLPCEVIDRSLLILDIFLRHARTNEAKLEIKLAHLKYLAPRLSSLRSGFDRQGGVGMRGPGETQLELDRRNIQNDILKIQNELKEIHKMKTLQIEKRKKNNFKTVALVGYTNAGKSTTMNKIIDFTDKDDSKKVLSENKLFATLNTSVRRIEYDGVEFLLTDTIGFVSKLPTHLIHSFRQTLEEVKEADLIIHVLDASSEYVLEQFDITMNVLHSIGASDKKMLILINKSDLCEVLPQVKNLDSLVYSNKNDTDVSKLLLYIRDYLLDDYQKMSLVLPYSDAKMLNFIIENTKVISKIYSNEGIILEIMSPIQHVKKLSLYEAKDDNFTN